MPSFLQSSLLMIRDFIFQDYDRYNEIEAAGVKLDDCRTILDIQKVARELPGGDGLLGVGVGGEESERVESWEEVMEGVRKAFSIAEEAQREMHKAQHNVCKEKAFIENARLAIQTASAMQRGPYGQRAVDIITNDTESHWPFGMKLVNDIVRVLQWNIIKGRTIHWSPDDKNAVIDALKEVLDDLDVDLRGNGIEGVSRLDYRQPIVAVKCNKKARAFPEDAKKTLDVIKEVMRRDRDRDEDSRAEYGRCPIDIDSESRIPYDEKFKTQYNQREYYSILLKFTELRREVTDTLSRGEGLPRINKGEDSATAPQSLASQRPQTDVEFLTSLQDLEVLSAIKTTQSTVRNATPRSADIPWRTR